MLAFRHFRSGGYVRTELLHSPLPDYSPLGIAPPLGRSKRRSPWIMIGMLLAFGAAIGIAFSR
jgi:hypothetical protein